MIIKNAILVCFSMCMLVSCTITQERVSGKYVDSTYNDSLKLNKDGSYVYIESLKSGILGLTEGRWKLENKRIQFSSDKNAFISYRLELNREQIDDKGTLKFVLGDSEKPLMVQQVKISNNDQIIYGENNIQTKNSLTIPDQFDFMVINTDNFANILIKDTLQANYQYKVRVFPLERLYELDKIPFLVGGKKLKGTQKTQYDDRVIKFKKTRK